MPVGLESRDIQTPSIWDLEFDILTPSRNLLNLGVDLDFMVSVSFKILCFDFDKNEAENDSAEGSQTYPFKLQ